MIIEESLHIVTFKESGWNGIVIGEPDFNTFKVKYPVYKDDLQGWHWIVIKGLKDTCEKLEYRVDYFNKNEFEGYE